MKRYLLSLAMFIATVNSYAQIDFEKGYFINNSNEKITCLIKNIDWKDNPTSFNYKLSDTAKEGTNTINLVKEFGIYGHSKYIKATIDIDRSSSNLNNLSKQRRPVFQKEKLFLKVLVEGKANLFSYNQNSLHRYFFSNQNNEITQLVFKKYRTENSFDAIYNERYKQQLWSSLKCDQISLKDTKKLKYKKKSLIDFFLKYNQCQKTDIVDYTKNSSNRKAFNLTIKSGVNISSLEIDRLHNSSETTAFKFDSKTTLKIGLEAEYILPYNKNKWSIIAEPSYEYFKGEATVLTPNVVGGSLSTSINYKSFQIPVGIRHYFHLSQKSQIFTNVSYVLDFPNQSLINFLRADNSNYRKLEITSLDTSILFAIGYKFNNKYLVEIKYRSGGNILNSHLNWSSKYNPLTLSVGYTLF
ncbi:outer membrane beta-barrel protein [Tenacibaculum sp.]|nr:outer membrane beta-barrel protein [Tenacibaculum sp.]